MNLSTLLSEKYRFFSSLLDTDGENLYVIWITNEEMQVNTKRKV